MKTSRSWLIGAFVFSANGVYPSYRKGCSDCNRLPSPVGLEISIDSLSILSRIPEEIKTMTPAEIDQFRSIIPKTYQPPISFSPPRGLFIRSKNSSLYFSPTDCTKGYPRPRMW